MTTEAQAHIERVEVTYTCKCGQTFWLSTSSRGQDFFTGECFYCGREYVLRVRVTGMTFGRRTVTA